jgi:hypothetical protein
MFQNFSAFQRQFAEFGQQLLTTDGNDSDDSDLDGLDTGGFGVALSKQRASEATHKPRAQSNPSELVDPHESSPAVGNAEVRG